jgi:hypothetical protein
LLTTRTKPQEVEAVEKPAEPPTETDYKAEAAAVAVAFALTQARARQQIKQKAGAASTSQWLLTGRLQQINQGIRGRRG